MEHVSKGYQLYDPNDDNCNNKINYYKRLFKAEGFLWFKTSRNSKVYIRDEKDILEGNRNISGTIDEGLLTTTNSRLENFLDGLDID